MAPKRSAPPPSAPAASSEETDSGSSEGSEEEEEGVAQAQTPPPSAPKGTATPPQQKDQESETSDDGEEEEEDEDVMAHTISSSATKNLPPPQPNREESDASYDDEEEEEEETDDEAPQPKQGSEGKKAAATRVRRKWSKDEEIRLLKALAALQREHGKLPRPYKLTATFAGILDVGGKDIPRKVKRLRNRYKADAQKCEAPSKGHAGRLFKLSKRIWGGGGDRGPRDFGEMCELYPLLAEEVKSLEPANQVVFKRAFTMMDDATAREMDAKIKKQKMALAKLEVRGYELSMAVNKTLVELMKEKD